MAYSNGKITAPISINDIKNALGDGSNDLGTLCKSSKINMWARFKPVIYPRNFDITDADRASANYGITIPSTIDTVAGVFADNLWAYAKPTGGASSPYRIGDFAGYYNAAVPPIGIVFSTSTLKVSGSSKDGYDFSAVFEFNNGLFSEGWDAANCMSLDELFSYPNFKQMYPTLLFRTPSDSQYTIVTGNRTIAEMESSSVYADPIVANSKYCHFNTYDTGTIVEVVACLQPNKFTTPTSSFGNYTYISLNFRPGVDKKSYSIVKDTSIVIPDNPTYSLSFTYTRSESSYYTYQITSVTITNTNGVESTVNIMGLIQGVYVNEANNTMASGVTVGKNATITINSLSNNYFTTVNTSCQGGLIVQVGDTQKTLTLPGGTGGTVS